LDINKILLYLINFCYQKEIFMKNNLFYLAVMLLITSAVIVAQAGEHIKDAVIVIKSPSGKTYKGTTDASGRCVFKDVDGVSGGWTVQMSYQKITFKAKEGASLSIEAAPSSSDLRESPTKSSKGTNPLYEESSNSGTNPLYESSNSSVSSPRDVSTGQSSGKRMHKPFTFKTTLCSNGVCADGSCDITLESDGTTITCTAAKSRSNVRNN
jgi:hypothetical protein